jgi:phage N-6-adenine-methyltransferase
MNDFLTKDSDEFTTPDHIFATLHAEFQFTIDAAATAENAKLDRWWTKEDDALKKSWAGRRVFCNPPYSRGNVKAFVLKALDECQVGGLSEDREPCQLAVLLIPTYTERTWYAANRQHFETRFIRGRLKFGGGATTARGNHMILIVRSINFSWYWTR